MFRASDVPDRIAVFGPCGNALGVLNHRRSCRRRSGVISRSAQAWAWHIQSTASTARCLCARKQAIINTRSARFNISPKRAPPVANSDDDTGGTKCSSRDALTGRVSGTGNFS